jgi:hypothetical protein
LRGEENTTTGQDLDRDTARTTQEIRSEIAQTRADMSETIEAIQDKLRPGNIAAAATDRIKNATSRAATRVADAASQTANATMTKTREFAGNGMHGRSVAQAMIGIGAAWLIVDRWRHSGARRREWRGSSYRTSAGTPQWRRADDYSTSYAQEEDVTTSDYPDAASRVRDVRTRAMQQGERAMDGFGRLLRSNPLMVAAAAMAVGAAVGLALPETERENEWMGEAREELFEHAQDVARSTASQVQRAAGDIAGQVASEIVGGDKGTSGSAPQR